MRCIGIDIAYAKPTAYAYRHAGAKWRVRKFEVIGKHERNEA